MKSTTKEGTMFVTVKAAELNAGDVIRIPSGARMIVERVEPFGYGLCDVHCNDRTESVVWTTDEVEKVS